MRISAHSLNMATGRHQNIPRKNCLCAIHSKIYEGNVLNHIIVTDQLFLIRKFNVNIEHETYHKSIKIHIQRF